MSKFVKTLLVVSGLVLVAPVTQAYECDQEQTIDDECDSVQTFIQLGDRASECIAAIRLNNSQASDVMKNDPNCKDVRSRREGVEDSVNNIAQATVNQCANKNIKNYTAAATALQKMYQFELSLRSK
ncbi:MAG: hypothetical protein ACC641_01050 [Acidiferrobacterales bacterium]